uniref:PA14 domain-containing protein n=1 Tax=Chromera velia CCMP2878 TaxID=1169474 RepID=A0A0G4F677_9ALVE|eukprot:Cvel_2782.t1-p1 / transcript=Cvel_2782.t1 / gene=Cvel_2782 / organism=Chromera_velia_CCMP2878 / gene_product=Hemicentin-1, putative / transcript_product=Hemicentin-1, putative / location=Cvel_scaffold112:41310-59800(+) / protein_length=2404 / sequence_SO=supercontig / SO=protein_coding / is_pseudo=false
MSCKAIKAAFDTLLVKIDLPDFLLLNLTLSVVLTERVIFGVPRPRTSVSEGDCAVSEIALTSFADGNPAVTCYPASSRSCAGCAKYDAANSKCEECKPGVISGTPDREEGTTVSCVVTAVESRSEGLYYNTTVHIRALPATFGHKTLVLKPGVKLPLLVSPGWSAERSKLTMQCTPSVSWFNENMLTAYGKLEVKPWLSRIGGGLSEEGPGGGTLQQMEGLNGMTNDIPLTEVQATKCRLTPGLPVRRGAPIRPFDPKVSRSVGLTDRHLPLNPVFFTLACEPQPTGVVQHDVITGLVSFQPNSARAPPFVLFSLDPTTGEIGGVTGGKDEALAALDFQSLDPNFLQDTVEAKGEGGGKKQERNGRQTKGQLRLLPGIGIGIRLFLCRSDDSRCRSSRVAPLVSDLQDTTCWQAVKLREQSLILSPFVGHPADFLRAGVSESACRSACSADPSCPFFRFDSGSGGTCKKGRVKNALVHGTGGGDLVSIMAKASCEPMTACVQLYVKGWTWYSSTFCPVARDALSGGDFLYERKGFSPTDAGYLLRASADDVLRDPEGKCGNRDWIMKQADPGSDFVDVESGHFQLKGPIVACIPHLDPSEVAGAFHSSERSGEALIWGPGGRGGSTSTKLWDLNRAPRGCSSPLGERAGKEEEEEQAEERGESAEKEEEGGGEEQSAEVFWFSDVDDPRGSFFLDPCESVSHCFPGEWGNNPPVSPEAFSMLPASGLNVVPGNTAQPQMIARGRLTCLLTDLIQSLPTDEEDLCAQRCRETSLCNYFWVGQLSGMPQCRLYRSCGALMSEPNTAAVSGGTLGTLFGIVRHDACLIADPEGYMAASKRRKLLTSVDSSSLTDLHELIPQSATDNLPGGDPAKAIDGVPNAGLWRESPYDSPVSCEHPKYIQLDMGGDVDMSAVRLWGYWRDGRTYCGVKVEVCGDESCFNAGNAAVVFDRPGDGPAETADGNLLQFTRTVRGRFVRVYMGRSTSNSGAHIIEVKVYGPKEVGAADSELTFRSMPGYHNAKVDTPLHPIQGDTSVGNIDTQDIPNYTTFIYIGTLVPPSTHNYAFELKSDDAGFVYIDGDLMVDNGGRHGCDVRSSVSLTASGTEKEKQAEKPPPKNQGFDVLTDAPKDLSLLHAKQERRGDNARERAGESETGSPFLSFLWGLDPVTCAGPFDPDSCSCPHGKVIVAGYGMQLNVRGGSMEDALLVTCPIGHPSCKMDITPPSQGTAEGLVYLLCGSTLFPGLEQGTAKTRGDQVQEAKVSCSAGKKVAFGLDFQWSSKQIDAGWMEMRACEAGEASCSGTKNDKPGHEERFVWAVCMPQGTIGLTTFWQDTIHFTSGSRTFSCPDGKTIVAGWKWQGNHMDLSVTSYSFKPAEIGGTSTFLRTLNYDGNDDGYMWLVCAGTPVNGGWSDWSGWSDCTKSCGTGLKTRSRTCTEPAPSDGGRGCTGDATQSSPCNPDPCPKSSASSEPPSVSELFSPLSPIACRGRFNSGTCSCPAGKVIVTGVALQINTSGEGYGNRVKTELCPTGQQSCPFQLLGTTAGIVNGKFTLYDEPTDNDTGIVWLLCGVSVVPGLDQKLERNSLFNPPIVTCSSGKKIAFGFRADMRIDISPDNWNFRTCAANQQKCQTETRYDGTLQMPQIVYAVCLPESTPGLNSVWEGAQHKDSGEVKLTCPAGKSAIAGFQYQLAEPNAHIATQTFKKIPVGTKEWAYDLANLGGNENGLLWMVCSDDKIDGGLSAWSDWSSCSRSCGGGTRMLGGRSVEECGKCTYLPKAEGDLRAKARSLPDEFPWGSGLRVSCWEQRYALVDRRQGTFGVRALEFVCVDGEWVDSWGGKGLDEIECAACVQVGKPSLSVLESQGMDFRYFLDRLPVQIVAQTTVTDPQRIVAEGDTLTGTKSPELPMHIPESFVWFTKTAAAEGRFSLENAGKETCLQATDADRIDRTATATCSESNALQQWDPDLLVDIAAGEVSRYASTHGSNLWWDFWNGKAPQALSTELKSEALISDGALVKGVKIEMGGNPTGPELTADKWTAAPGFDGFQVLEFPWSVSHDSDEWTVGCGEGKLIAGISTHSVQSRGGGKFSTTSGKLRCVAMKTAAACEDSQIQLGSAEFEEGSPMDGASSVGSSILYEKEAGLRGFSVKVLGTTKVVTGVFTCCQAGSPSVTLQPLPFVSNRGFFLVPESLGVFEKWEGEYCPTGHDETGRLEFTQRVAWGNPVVTPFDPSKLSFIYRVGKWCVDSEGTTCLASAAVNPALAPVERLSGQLDIFASSPGGQEEHQLSVSTIEDFEVDKPKEKSTGTEMMPRPPPPVRPARVALAPLKALSDYDVEQEYLPYCRSAGNAQKPWALVKDLTDLDSASEDGALGTQFGQLASEEDDQGKHLFGDEYTGPNADASEQEKIGSNPCQ